ncbi:MAG: protein phosphatase 2C domain-containing protein [Eubacteriales bacterium]
MPIHDIALIGLGMCIVMLILAKLTKKKEVIETAPEPISNLGGSMTIGSREVQEDCYYINQNKQGSFLALADGMGESYGGRIASRIAISVCEDMFSTFNLLDNPRYFFRKIFNNSNKEILKALDNGGKGYSSLATALICDNKLFYSVVGNVKVFVFRNNDLVEVSTGHTLESISKTEFIKGKITRSEARSLLEDHRLYNFLGQDGFSDLEIFDTPVSLKANDIVLLMTDGVYELLAFTELESVLSKKISSQQKAYEIIELINKNSNEDKDNGSIVIWQGMGANV